MAEPIVRSPYYPIVYVRGFAATMSEIENTVATPYMGFNLGATKIRQDAEGEIVRFIFESPLLRLIKDDQYIDAYQNGDFIPLETAVPARSVWVFRYYEDEERPGTGERKTIPGFAEELRAFILRIREQVCLPDPRTKPQFRVYLVAHSMGGLICRCYLQNLCRYGVHRNDGTLDPERNKTLELENRTTDRDGFVDDSVHLVDKLFTYGTPHNGIEMVGRNVPDVGWLDPWHVRNFNRDAMREYLAIEQGRPVNSLDKAFDPRRVFCFVGTNYHDYAAFYNLSHKATGPMSDGLVMIRNATVAGAPRAFAHRSHSGDYGIVNSEEGYQNLRRFLFGYWQADAWLYADCITLPVPLQKRQEEGREVRASYQTEVTLSVRGAKYHLYQRKVAHASAIRAEQSRWVEQGHPLRLFSTYLREDAKTKGSKRLQREGGDNALAFVLQLAIERPLYEVQKQFWEFWIDDHFEESPIFQEAITFHVNYRAPKQVLQYGLASDAGSGAVNRAPDVQQLEDGAYRIELRLGFEPGIRRPPQPGFSGRLVLLARRRPGHTWG